jgi:hypothetical protein
MILHPCHMLYLVLYARGTYSAIYPISFYITLILSSVTEHADLQSNSKCRPTVFTTVIISTAQLCGCSQ